MDALEEVLFKFSRNRVLAHEVLFAARHPNKTAPYQRDIIRDWHSDEKWLLEMVFRGGAKSTIAEEAILIKSALREIRNYLIIGSSLDRACERLASIRHEVEQNEIIAQTFGDLRGPTWGDTELVFSNGVRLLALGRGQALRGVKYLDARPDGFFIDDIETKSDVRTPEARKAVLDWVLTDLIPALDVTKAHGRCAATPLDPEALPYQLERAGWRVKKYPVEYRDKAGARRATWPDRVPLEKIDQIRETFEKTGSMREYNAEYMCQAEAPGEKTFKQEMMRIEPVIRTWQNVFGMYDPARTVNAGSATTGHAQWSWIGHRLIVWDGWGKMLMPDEIISDMFDFNERMHPVWIGVEEDGLNQWLLQPIRQEQVRRGVVLPIRPVKAPKGKIDFIRGLQPYFNARECVFARELPDLWRQFLSFPTGKIDAPNALAYAPRMRPGAPMYEDFGARNVADDLRPMSGRPLWLAISCSGSAVTAALCQVLDGAVRVYADWMREGDAQSVFEPLMKDVMMEAGQRPRLVMPPIHFDRYNNMGLRQAAMKLGHEVRQGTPMEMGRGIIRDLLKADIKNVSALLVGNRALWTTNGFAGGYCRGLLKGGMLAEYAEEGPYRVLMEGVESFAGLLRAGMAQDDDEESELRYDVSSNGRRFLSARR